MAWAEAEGQSRVCVAIPHTGAFSSEWTERMYVPLKLADPLVEKIFRLCRGTPLPAARTLLVREALKADCTHIFFLDSDVITEIDPNIALKMLLYCNSPIVSGLYRYKKKTGFKWAIWGKVKGGYAPVNKWTGNWIKVDAIPLGLCLIKIGVFRKLPEPWFYWEDPDAVSEDFYFSELARKHGYEIRVLTEVRASHVLQGKVKSDGTITTLEV